MNARLDVLTSRNAFLERSCAFLGETIKELRAELRSAHSTIASLRTEVIDSKTENRELRVQVETLTRRVHHAPRRIIAHQGQL